MRDTVSNHRINATFARVARALNYGPDRLLLTHTPYCGWSLRERSGATGESTARYGNQCHTKREMLAILEHMEIAATLATFNPDRGQ